MLTPTSQTAADLVVAEAGLCALGDSPSLDAECSSAVSDIYDWILGFILPGPEFSRRERLGSDDEGNLAHAIGLYYVGIWTVSLTQTG